MNINTYDVRTLIGLLVWGNLTCVALISSYILLIKDAGDKDLGKSVILAKLSVALGFFLISCRWDIPDVLSMNLGNSLVIAGTYFEGRSVLMLLGKKWGKHGKFHLMVALLVILASNLTIFLWPKTLLRNVIGSFGIFAILVGPTMRLLFSDNVTPFKRVVGLFYLLFSLLLLPRGLYFILYPEALEFTVTPIQGMTYTSLLLLTIFSLSTFLLLMKEESDKKLKALARTDFLTGLNNRQYFLASVSVAFERHRREKISCSVLFMDVDHFKSVNDTYGHAFGDEVLKFVSTVISAAVRGYDVPCRFGGEEFAAFIDNANPDVGVIVAERIRKQMKEASFAEHPDFRFSISVGVVTGVPREGDTINTFIDQADEALYEAKEKGRDRVVARQIIEAE